MASAIAPRKTAGGARQSSSDTPITFRDIVDYIRFHPLEEQNQWANLIPKLEQFAAEADRQRGQGQGDDERPPDELVVVTELLRDENVMINSRLLKGILRAVKIALRNPRNRSYLREETIEAITSVFFQQNASISCIIEACNCVLNMCHYQKNIDILLEKENTLRKLIQLYIEADSFEEHSRLLKSSTIGSLQSLCYYAQGRLFLRRALNENIGEETIEKKFFVLIHGDLLPVPFGVDDNIFSAYAIASSRNDDQAIKKLRRTVEERRQILQRCLGCLLNVSSDPELGAWISGTEGLIGTITEYLDVPFAALVTASLKVVQNLARSGVCRKLLKGEFLLEKLTTLSLSGDVHYQTSAAGALLNLLAPHVDGNEDGGTEEETAAEEGGVSIQEMDPERVETLRQIRQKVRSSLSDNFALGLIWRQLTTDEHIPISSVD